MLLGLALVGPSSAAMPDEAGAGYGAVLRASERAVLSAGIDGRVTHVARREGEAFAAGDTLLELDCTRQDAILLRSIAQNDYAALDHASNRQLASLNSVSDLQLADSERRLAESRAQLATSEFAVRQCTLIAPFDGVLTHRSIEPHEHVTAGRELLQIVSNRNLEVEFLAPSEALASIRVDGSFTLQLDERRQAIDGTVAVVVPSVDAVSRTIKVIGRLGPDDAGTALWAGMSGWVRLHD